MVSEIGPILWMGELGAVAATARKRHPEVYFCKRCWHAETAMKYCMVGLGAIEVNCFKYGHLDTPSHCTISSMN